MPALLKTIEEPPGSTVFIALAEFVPPELETIASRSARIDFRPLTEGEVSEVLVQAMASPAQAGRYPGPPVRRTFGPGQVQASDTEAEARVGAPGKRCPLGSGTGAGATVALMAEELVEVAETQCRAALAAPADRGRRGRRALRPGGSGSSRASRPGCRSGRRP